MEGYIAAVVPWKSLDAETEIKVTTHDKQEQINRCLSCPYMCCRNCLDAKNKEASMAAGEKQAKLLDEFCHLISANKNPMEICMILGISRATYFNYKKKIISI